MFLDGWRSANFAVLDTNDLILIVKIFSVMVSSQHQAQTRNNRGWQYGICTPLRIKSSNWAEK